MGTSRLSDIDKTSLREALETDDPFSLTEKTLAHIGSSFSTSPPTVSKAEAKRGHCFLYHAFQSLSRVPTDSSTPTYLWISILQDLWSKNLHHMMHDVLSVHDMCLFRMQDSVVEWQRFHWKLLQIQPLAAIFLDDESSRNDVKLFAASHASHEGHSDLMGYQPDDLSREYLARMKNPHTTETVQNVLKEHFRRQPMDHHSWSVLQEVKLASLSGMGPWEPMIEWVLRMRRWYSVSCHAEPGQRALDTAILHLATHPDCQDRYTPTDMSVFEELHAIQKGLPHVDCKRFVGVGHRDAIPTPDVKELEEYIEHIIQAEATRRKAGSTKSWPEYQREWKEHITPAFECLKNVHHGIHPFEILNERLLSPLAAGYMKDILEMAVQDKKTTYSSVKRDEALLLLRTKRQFLPNAFRFHNSVVHYLQHFLTIVNGVAQLLQPGEYGRHPFLCPSICRPWWMTTACPSRKRPPAFWSCNG